ncbi:DNA polymerase I [Prolixibacter sp. NT017]|uniref:DNA polymerase I n=1 Tax=Prolixibacter sp. NT017 TaxID=2652390 RepID=UPI00127DFAA1|nr:DNA polymerase I [Prolixibacter sp. NT017]GET27202.1 DNA polymerase I [Prolixibacter sp. NT017]
MAEKNPKRLFLLDAYALIYRSYFAFIKNPRYNSKGLNTSAIMGFLNTLEQILKQEDPSHIAVAFDLKAPTFRHEMYEPYKANREEMPEDLRKSIPYIRQLIEAYHIPIVEREGFEADDVIGTLAKSAEKEGYEVFMVTPDKDYAQLVSENIFMYKPKRSGNDLEVWGLKEVSENFQVQKPEQVIDILGLMGDTADNIPGCPGIGPKTAMKLISDFASVDGVYQNIDKLKGKQKERLVENEDQVRISRKLAKIILDVPLDAKPDGLVRTEPDKNVLRDLFSELEFKTLAKRILNEEVPVQQENNFQQGTLFGAPESPQEPEMAPENISDINLTDHEYFLMDTPELRADLRADLCVLKEFCFDTETTDIDPHTAQLVGMSFSWKDHEAFYVPVPADQKEAQALVDEFRSIFADERIMKIGQNIKYDILVMGNYGIEVKGEIFDTMIAHYLVQPELRHNLDYLSELFLGYKKVATEELIGKKGKNQRSMRDVAVSKIKEYAGEDADITWQLKPILARELEKAGVEKLFREVEMPLLNVLVDMEQAGVKIDKEALDAYAEKLREQIITLEKDIHQLAGEDFNVSSPKQLGVILFEKLKLDSKAKKTKTKQYSTNEETLVKLQDKHEIVGKVLDYRGLKKLLSTYVEALPKLINARTGKIHTSFNQAIAATGRLSSNNPNLQNIPIRDENGREIRKAFVPSDDKHVYLSADYSQIELRIMAAISGDKAMMEAFRNGEDIHATTAAKIYGVPLNEVTSDMRRKAKTANFGIIYGISAFGLSQRLNIPRTEAKQLIDGYFENFSRVKQFMDEQIHNAREKGYVETLMGRKRYLPDINSSNAVVRGVAERNAINAPIQGSAADVIKVAMINIHRKMQEKGLKSKMMLQVHDELNFDALKDELEVLKKLVKHEMEHAVELDVPLTVDMQSAANWLEAH